MWSETTLSLARERLTALVGPVTLRVPQADPTMQCLTAALADGDLLQSQPYDGQTLTLLDGWGRETGMHFADPPVGQELTALLEAILAASRGSSLLSPLGRAEAQSLPAGTALWVLVTPT